MNDPNAYTSHMTVAYFICDWGSDKTTTLTPPIPVPDLNTTFLSAVDLYVRGATPPYATISIVDIPHGDCGAMHTVNVPDWASINASETLTESVSVVLDDYIHSRCDETRSPSPKYGYTPTLGYRF